MEEITAMPEKKRAPRTEDGRVIDKNGRIMPKGMRPWEPGESGNPSGRPKITVEQKEMMEQIKALGPKCVKAMEEILDGRSALARVRMVEVILSYIIGKPESNVKVEVSMADRVQKSELRIAALVQSIKLGGQMSDAEYGSLGEPARLDEGTSQNRADDWIQRLDGVTQPVDPENSI